MATHMSEVDRVLEALVAERREEVVALQKQQAQQIKDQESRGQKQLSTLQKALPEQFSDLLYAVEKSSAEEEKATAADVEKMAAQLAGSKPDPSRAAEDPGLGRGSFDAARAAVGWLTPYYGTLHGSDGTVYWQGYNPGVIDAWVSVNGSGSGIFGTGASSFTVYMDWWFTFRAPENRNYSQQAYIPYNGFYIVRADDGWFDSKEAKVRIDMSSRGYQYNWKPGTSTNVLSISNDNINVNDRFDGYRSNYYSTLLGADQAYMLLSTSLYTYARGGGSTAQLNFSDGDANKLGVPLLYVS